MSKREHSAYSFLIILNRIHEYSSHPFMNSLAYFHPSVRHHFID